MRKRLKIDSNLLGELSEPPDKDGCSEDARDAFSA